MQVQDTVTRPHLTPRFGPAPARMGAAATVPVDPVQDIAAPLRAFPWVAKRFAIWSLGTILSATAFHLTGFVLIGVIAIVFPIAYWAKISIEERRVFGPGAPESQMSLVFKGLHEDTQRTHQRNSRNRLLGY